MSRRRKERKMPLSVRGPFIVNWNDPGVTSTGVALFTPAVGDILLDVWWETVTAFTDAGGPTAVALEFRTVNDVVADTGPLTIPADTGTDVDLVADQSETRRLSVAGDLNAPVRFKVATPLRLKLLPNAGALTAGQIRVYATLGATA